MSWLDQDDTADLLARYLPGKPHKRLGYFIEIAEFKRAAEYLERLIAG